VESADYDENYDGVADTRMADVNGDGWLDTRAAIPPPPAEPPATLAGPSFGPS
jgi:hypothetical protein